MPFTISPLQIGLVGVQPSLLFINSTDNALDVFTPGYLGNGLFNGIPLSNFQTALVSLNGVGNVWCNVAISDGVGTLVPTPVLPTAVGCMALLAGIDGTSWPSYTLGGLTQLSGLTEPWGTQQENGQFMMNSDGELTYTGLYRNYFLINASYNFIPSSGLAISVIEVAVNGVVAPNTYQVSKSGYTATSVVLRLSPGDYLSIFAGAGSGSHAGAIACAQLTASQISQGN